MEFFEKKIRPVLVENCYGCHSSKLAEPMGGLRVDSSNGLHQGGGPTTPLQQLFVLNSEWMRHQAARLALRLSDIGDPAARVRALYRLALGRNAKAGEIDLAQSFLDRRRAELGRYPWEEYAQALLGTNEFIFFN